MVDLRQEETMESRMAILSDEDGEVAYVPVNDEAPTAEAVEAGWRDAAFQHWGMKYDEYEADAPIDITRSWAKPDLDEDRMTLCSADDPDRSEEFWTFELPIGEIA